MNEIEIANIAHQNYEQIVTLRKSINLNFWQLVERLKLARDNRQWVILDCESWASYLAQPEIDFNEHTVDNWITIYNSIKQNTLLPPEGVIDIDVSKLAIVAPHLTPENAEELLLKAKNLSRSDLREEIKLLNPITTPELPEGKFNVIYADPPWKYDVDLTTGETRSPENNYPVMDLEELVAFGEKIRAIASENCVLFLWITAPKLNWLNDVLTAWGFTYKTNLIWDKIKPMMGHYSSVRHEILVIAGKGNSAPVCDGVTIQSIDSVQSIDKTTTHSEKPEEFRKIIEKLYPNGKYIELFARRKINGWDCWGNEV